MTMQSEENQYIDLINRILTTGSREEGRNGTTLSVFGNMMRFRLQDGRIPLLTTKKVAWKTCFNELFWFIRGSTDNTEMRTQNVHIWDANCSREFLDNRGLTHLQEDDLGPVYGHQWRHFNAEYTDCNSDYTGKGKDQLMYIIDALKDPAQRSSRRLVMSAWNPCQIDEMALPPCHVLCQFNVHDGNKLSCSLYQRSGDVGLGVPFNIASYSLLTHLIAKHCGLGAYEFVYFLGNAHIYENHIEPLKLQILREPIEFPRIEIAEKLDNIESYDLASVLWKTDYVYHKPIKMDMVA